MNIHRDPVQFDSGKTALLQINEVKECLEKKEKDFFPLILVMHSV